MSGHTFEHLLALSTPLGTFEHADGVAPRREHGFCTDDVARVLVVTSREPDPPRAVLDLARSAHRFVADAQGPTGRIRNRRDASGRWRGRRGLDDCWGRAVWGLGTAARLAHEDGLRRSALASFDHGARQRSPHRRAMAFAALGAAEVLVVHAGHHGALRLMADAAVAIGRPQVDPAWPWVEPRLTYANAALAEALLAAGEALGRDDLVEDGLVLLGWLWRRETVSGHLSPTPVGGSGPGDVAPAFDQQPIEVASMADACTRAATVTGDPTWLDGVDMAVRWFRGDNDLGVTMWDPCSGGGYDGLTPTGPNLNQGAESTLAAISTLQHAARLTVVGPRGS